MVIKELIIINLEDEYLILLNWNLGTFAKLILNYKFI